MQFEFHTSDKCFNFLGSRFDLLDPPPPPPLREEGYGHSKYTTIFISVFILSKHAKIPGLGFCWSDLIPSIIQGGAIWVLFDIFIEPKSTKTNVWVKTPLSEVRQWFDI